jgi:hypothetical protein
MAVNGNMPKMTPASPAHSQVSGGKTLAVTSQTYVIGDARAAWGGGLVRIVNSKVSVGPRTYMPAAIQIAGRHASPHDRFAIQYTSSGQMTARIFAAREPHELWKTCSTSSPGIQKANPPATTNVARFTLFS